MEPAQVLGERRKNLKSHEKLFAVILIGLGANLPSPRYGPPAETLRAALSALEEAGITITARSRFYESAPVPVSDQPWFVNCVVAVRTALRPHPLLHCLLSIERGFGRIRGTANAARVLDLDLLAYDDVVFDGENGLRLPHPRMHERAFVLLPLAEIAPGWRHPESGSPLSRLIEALAGNQTARPLPD